MIPGGRALLPHPQAALSSRPARLRDISRGTFA